MRFRKTLWACVLLLLAAAGGILHAAEGDIFTLLDDSNLRQGPDSAYASVGVAQEGEQAVEIDSKGHWLKVRITASGDVGWLYADSLQHTVSGEAPMQLPTSDNISNTAETKPSPVSTQEESTLASDVTVAEGLNGGSAVDEAVTGQNNEPEVAASMFVDGATSGAVTPVATDAEVKQGDVTVSDVLDQQTGSEAVPDAPVSQTEIVKKEPPSDNHAVGLSEPVVRGKNVTNSKVQNVIEAGGLDDKSGVSAASASFVGDQEMTVPVTEPVAVVTDQRDAQNTGNTAELNGQPAVAEANVGDTRQNDLARAAESTVVVNSKAQQVEVADVLNEGSVNAEAIAGSEQAKAVEASTPESVASEPVALSEADVTGPAVAELTVAEPAPLQTDASRNVVQEVQTAHEKPAPQAEAPVLAGGKYPAGMHQVVKTTTIRTGPGALYDVLGWVGRGARVEAVGQQGGWLQVRMQAGGRKGWIKAVALQPLDVAQNTGSMPVNAEPQAQPEPTVRNAQVAEMPQPVEFPVLQPKAVDTDETSVKASPVAEPTTESTDNNVVHFVKTANLRAGPDSKFDVVAWAGKGANAVELARKGDWVRVRMQESSRIGWVHKNLLKRANAGANLSVATVLSDQVTEAQEASVVASPEASRPGNEPAMVMSDPLASQTRQQNAARQPSAMIAQPEVLAVKPAQPEHVAGSPDAVTGSTQRSLFSFNRKANLRAGPAAKFDVVTWADVGSYASELARNGDWVRVQMQVSKRVGWVYDRSLMLVKAGVSLPAVTVASDQVVEEPVVRVSSTARSKVADGLFTFKKTGNIHAGPGKQYDVIAWGGKHESAKIIARQGDWRKIRMTVSGRVGWVFNTLLVGTGIDRAAVAPPAKPAGAIQGGEIYQALRTEPLRSDAVQFSELTDWVSKGEAVALLEWHEGWMRVQPQNAEKKAGWIKREFLKRTEMSSTKVPNDHKLPGVDRVVEYQDRISKGEAFNFSYAALEQALYRIPIEDIHVRIGKDDLKAMFRKDTYDKSSFEIRLRTGRRHLQGRIKVLGSSTRIFKKKSLLIKLDKESTRWYGRRRIALRSMASDKALMREWMAWKLLAAMGAKVPEVHFTRVSFNHGEKTGLYLSIEWLGKQFLEANHLDVNGGFYQPNDASHCGDLNSSENMDLCFDKITPQDGDYSMLRAMAKAVSSADASDMDTVLAQYFDDESVLNWIAVNALVTNGDTYNKNYWLHYSPTRKKWTVIPWDYNLTFGRVYDPFANKLSEQPFRIFNDNFQYFFPPDVGSSNPLKDKTVHNAKLRARLETKLKHLLGMEPNGPEETFGWFSPTVMQARIGNLAAVVGKEVYKDTFLTFGEEEFTKTYESLMHYVTAHDHYLGAKLQGPYMWEPSPPFDPAQPPVLVPLPKELYGHGYIDADGQSLHMTDQGWGYFVARLNLDAPLKKKAEFKVNVEGGVTPKYLPTGQSPRRCVQRSWVLSTQTSDFTADGTLMVEYIQENSRRTEVPETLHEELLELWVLDGHHWKPLKTEVNEYANTLTAKGVHLESGHIQRFVACSPF